MSHSFEAHSGGTVFVYNSDLSGRVTIWTPEMGDDKPVIEVNGNDLLEFVAEVVRREKISQLEIMTDKQVLGIEK